jgi:CheY-like chemotaxis protein
MRILILEDTDARIVQFQRKLIGHEVTICKKADECIKVLTDQPPFDYIFLDHDLTSEFSRPGKDTGYEVAEWIATNPDKCPRRILIHSLNNIGAAAMMRRLGDADLRASYIPFLWEKLQTERLHESSKQ